MTKKAMKIAYNAHKEQVDKTGIPYIFHPIHLAEEMNDEISVCAALLHDVVEDTAMTFDDLSRFGISDEVIGVLKILTHDKSVQYYDYIQNIKDSKNLCAKLVKLADLRHNSDVTRLNEIDVKALSRIVKYKSAIEILEN